MGIHILLTIFLFLVKLVGSYLQEAQVCPMIFEQIAISAIIKNNLTDYPFCCAGKLATKDLYLLNIIIVSNSQKELLIPLIYIEFPSFQD